MNTLAAPLGKLLRAGRAWKTWNPWNLAVYVLPRTYSKHLSLRILRYLEASKCKSRANANFKPKCHFTLQVRSRIGNVCSQIGNGRVPESGTLAAPVFPLLIFALSLLTGCVTPAPQNSEVTISAPLAKVRQSAVAFLVANQWRPTRSDDLVLVFQKDGTASDIMLVDSGSKQQLTLTLMEHTNGVRLLGFGARLYRFGERTHLDIVPGVQWHLDGIKATALGQPIPETPKPERLPPAKTGKGAS
jgi:hypothetical protein